MNLTIDELQQNYEKLLEFIETTFLNGEVKDKLLTMYGDLGNRMILTPASSFTHFHGCFPGGYINHVLNVIKFSGNMYKLWKHHGADMSGYTETELMFAALNHDLGKIGDNKHDMYVPCESDWHIRNQGKYYEINPKIPNMRVSDRSLFLLQHYSVPMTHNEYLAIQIHDGPFEPENDFYFKVWDENKIIKNNLPLVLHQADYMAYRIEHEQWKKSKATEKYNPLKKEKQVKPESSDKKFDELFEKLGE